MFVAVIVRQGIIWKEDLHSARPRGEWAAVIADSAEGAAKAAIRHRDGYDSSGTKYDIWVGELTHQVKVPIRFKLVKL